MKLNILFPLHFSNHRISYTCNYLAKNMNHPDLSIKVICPSRSKDLEVNYVDPIFPEYIGRALGRANRDFTAKLAEEFFIRRSKEGFPSYIWSDCTPGFVERLRKQTSVVFAEKFNGLAASQKELLDEAYEVAKLPATHGVDQKKIDNDFERIAASDFVFVANPIAGENMISYGIPKEKIIWSSYGFDEKRFFPRQGHKTKEQKVTFIFAGVAGIRKGMNLLLQAWERANVDAKLLIAGPVSEEVASRCSSILNREDVVQLGWVQNVERIYGDADVFLFPTHEEGGPLVTFEAMASGLPVIVSPMGATNVARDSLDGFVINPYDIEAWAEAIRKLALDSELRRHMSETAIKRSQDFTWKKVGANRRMDVLQRLNIQF